MMGVFNIFDIILKIYSKKISTFFFSKFSWNFVVFSLQNRTKSGNVLFVNRIKLGTALIETALTGESLYTEMLAETIESDPLCITDLFQNKSVAYL